MAQGFILWALDKFGKRTLLGPGFCVLGSAQMVLILHEIFRFEIRLLVDVAVSNYYYFLTP